MILEFLKKQAEIYIKNKEIKRAVITVLVILIIYKEKQQ
jgi:hypothetical protein